MSEATAAAALEVQAEAAQEYAWEGLFERSWEAVEEAADGSLRSLARTRWRASRREVQKGVRRAVVRSVFIVIDCSRYASEGDEQMKPSRLAVMQQLVSDFVTRFFEQNPVSSISLVVTKNAKAEALTPPSSNARQHVQALQSVAECAGEPSLQNALEFCRESLSTVANFVSREVILLSASLSTCDPGDLFGTIARLAQDKVRCSVFSLLAEVFVCRKLARDTGGDYGVALNADHLADMLAALLPPRPIPSAMSGPSNSLVRVGFPVRQPAGASTLCFSAGSATPTVGAEICYVCPQCASYHKEIPTECPICSLKLLASTDLTKTYHHLFPLSAFTEETVATDSRCFACADLLPSSSKGAAPGSLAISCPECHAAFCAPCDELLHDSLHACPSCEILEVRRTFDLYKGHKD